MEVRRLGNLPKTELRKMLRKPILSSEEARKRLVILRAYVTIMGEHYGEGTNHRFTTPRRYISEVAEVLEGTGHSEVSKKMATYIGGRFEVRLTTAVLTAWIYELKESSDMISATFRRLDGGAAPLAYSRKGIRLDSQGRPCNRAGIPFIA